MRTYTLHLPAEASPGEAGALDRAVLVKDGFSWGAFFFSALWFFFHRLWIAGLLVLIAVIGLGALLDWLNLGRVAAGLAELLLGVLIGLEANSLYRWTLVRRGWPAVDVVTARDREEAETKAFARWLTRRGPSLERRATPIATAPAGLAASAGYRGLEPVIGLFPEAERGR